MTLWPAFRDAGMLRSWCDDEPRFIDYWTKIFDTTAAGEIDTWDYQFLFTCWAYHGLTCVPRANLVSNLGFGSDATHTTDADNPLGKLVGNLVRREIEIPLRHPPFICRDCNADKKDEVIRFSGPPSLKLSQRLNRFAQKPMQEKIASIGATIRTFRL